MSEHHSPNKSWPKPGLKLVQIDPSDVPKLLANRNHNHGDLIYESDNSFPGAQKVETFLGKRRPLTTETQIIPPEDKKLAETRSKFSGSPGKIPVQKIAIPTESQPPPKKSVPKPTAVQPRTNGNVDELSPFLSSRSTLNDKDIRICAEFASLVSGNISDNSLTDVWVGPTHNSQSVTLPAEKLEAYVQSRVNQVLKEQLAPKVGKLEELINNLSEQQDYNTSSILVPSSSSKIAGDLGENYHRQSSHPKTPGKSSHHLNHKKPSYQPTHDRNGNDTHNRVDDNTDTHHVDDDDDDDDDDNEIYSHSNDNIPYQQHIGPDIGNRRKKRRKAAVEPTVSPLIAVKKEPGVSGTGVRPLATREEIDLTGEIEEQINDLRKIIDQDPKASLIKAVTATNTREQILEALLKSGSDAANQFASRFGDSDFFGNDVQPTIWNDIGFEHEWSLRFFTPKAQAAMLSAFGRIESRFDRNFSSKPELDIFDLISQREAKYSFAELVAKIMEQFRADKNSSLQSRARFVDITRAPSLIVERFSGMYYNTKGMLVLPHKTQPYTRGSVTDMIINHRSEAHDYRTRANSSMSYQYFN